ncbi:protein kinase [Angomonas deanei]|nr:protein kinase [Angomonas deanei]|eukprot:EPY26501.1 protein kinase [Angomonas deanei]
MASVSQRSSGRQRFSGVSMPRELSQTPSISRLGSTVFAHHLQKCYVESETDDDHPLERMKVTFEEDELQLTTTGLLGKGGFGKVFVAESGSGELYAMKVSSKKMSEADWKRLNEEVTLMSHFSRHPNIVKFFTAGRDNDRAYVVMERCASRSLHDVIASRSLETPEILWIGWSLLSTISYIHSKGCIHRDLKPQNLLFDFEGNLKITDFGLSSRVSETQPRKTVAGTAMYMAPEMADEVFKRMTKTGDTPSLSYGQEVDAWSVGVVFYVMMTRMNPYLEALEASGMDHLNKEQKSLALFNSVAKAKWSWPKRWSGNEQLMRVVERLLHADPNERCSLEEILEDPIWEKRPLSCPLSLRQKLNLLEPSPISAPLSNLSENITQTKRNVNTIIEEALKRVESTEHRARTCIMLEYQETFTILFNAIALSRAETAERRAIAEKEESARQNIFNRRHSGLNKKKRGGSVALVQGVADDDLTPGRRSVSRRSSVSLLEANSDEGLLVRSSPDQYAVAYPGRENSTRWNLRPVISLPREFTADIEQEFKCMNNHVMTKLTSMPHGYNGFDCNVCDRGILKITADAPAFRCFKCDYDVCGKCAFSKRFKDVKIVCVSCGKKFVTTAKLQAHSLQCRGPSASPSPRSSSRMNTMLWDESKRPSLLEVQLPEDNTRRSGQKSGRPTYVRTSEGGRISIGNPKISSPEDMRDKVVPHKDANFPEVKKRGRPSKRRDSQAKSSDDSFL